MGVRDLYSNTKVNMSLVPSVRTSSTVGVSADLRGYDAAIATVSFGAYHDGVHAAKLQHSVDGVTYTDVSAAETIGVYTVVDAVEKANAVQTIAYVGQRRYLRVVMDVSSATDGAASVGTIIAGSPHNTPV